QGGMAGPARVVLVGDGRPEERHDAVPGELLDCPLEAMDTLGEDLEEPVEQPVPFLGVEPLGELHRVDHVGEQHGDLLPLALQRTARAEDLLDQVARRVRARLARGIAGPAPREPLPARIAEAPARPGQGGTVRAGDTPPERGAALTTEVRAVPVLVSAAGAPHGCSAPPSSPLALPSPPRAPPAARAATPSLVRAGLAAHAADRTRRHGSRLGARCPVEP